MKKNNENVDYAITAINSLTGSIKKDLKIFEFESCNISMILIMFYKPASTGMIDTGNGTLYEKIMGCLIKDDKIQLLKDIYPEEFSKVIKSEMGFIPSSIAVEIVKNNIILRAKVSWDKWFGQEKEKLDINTQIPIAENWNNLKDVFE